MILTIWLIVHGPSRGLPVITNNQAGNIIMECLSDRIDFFVENRQFARTRQEEGETEISKFGGYFIVLVRIGRQLIEIKNSSSRLAIAVDIHISVTFSC